jgi:glucan phosphoethanolaminetransferase (alkaline phosphatase superfamily)
MIQGPRPARRGWVVAAVAIAGLAACSQPAPRLNVVLIVVDTLRADHLGVYGYERETSSGIDRWAK